MITQSSIVMQRVVKYFGKRPVLYALDLEIARGEFVAIVGRSGCGKSTLLRILQGLDAADGGSVTIDGQPLRGLCPVARTVFQDCRLLPWKRVGANVGLGDLRRDERGIEQVLCQVGMIGRQACWPSQLSGGEKQRVALARALLVRPEVLFLDEPLASLDALTCLELQALIEQLWQQSQLTAVLVTHDIEEAVFLADRILLMSNGHIVEQWRNTLPRPRRRDSLEFMSLTNSIRGSIVPNNSGSPAQSAWQVETVNQAV